MSRFRTLLASLALGFLAAAPAAAKCAGQDLFATMPPDQLSAIEAAASAVPFPTGNFWRATRGDETIVIAGTYHFDDPRHLPNLEALTPHIKAAKTVFVEAGPDEEKQLMQLISRDPSKMVITQGPTLAQSLPPEVWKNLSQALSQRGIPGFMAAKLRPWYVAVLLSVPPCALAEMKDPKGLDGMIIDTATAAGVPVRGLEPFDTVFDIFDAMTEAEMIALIQSTLAVEDQSEDYSATLASSYFAGESRKVWEFMRQATYDLPGYTHEQVDAEFGRMEELMMAKRNRTWIPVLTKAAAEGPVFAGFGALHLSGKDGVLNLLQSEGYTIEALPL